MIEKIEKGAIIEIKVPNVEKPIKAVVLDVIENMTVVTVLIMCIFYMHRRESLKPSIGVIGVLMKGKAIKIGQTLLMMVLS